MDYIDPLNEKQPLINQDMQRQMKYAAQDGLQWFFKMMGDLLRAVAGFIGQMFHQLIGR